MKIAVVNASAAGSVSERMMRIVNETLAELGEEVVHIRLDRIKMPFFGLGERLGEEGAISAIHDAIYEIMSADGAVFVAPASLGGLCALMKAFMEHFGAAKFTHALLDKSCMVVSTSDEMSGIGGAGPVDREVFDAMSRIIGALGGYDAVRAYIPHMVMDAEEEEARLFLEKQTEDYYRILRQNRRFYSFEAYSLGKAAEGLDEKPEEPDIQLATEIRQLALNHDFTEEQEQDVSEIARFVTERIRNPERAEKPAMPVRPRNKTCRQLTSSMPHYFNSQLAAGIRTSIAMNITGSENFSGTLFIDGGQCHYDEGASPDAEMQINADAKIWMDILIGKLSAQKAFMVGQLKVRGNFLLLTKMDQFFSRMEP